MDAKTATAKFVMVRHDLSPAELTAVVIALDELQAYVDVIGEDNADEEAGLRKIQWAIKQLREVLRSHDVVVPGVNI